MVVAIVGTYLVLGSHAAAPYASITAESGTLSGSASKQSCSGASSNDGNCVVFGGTSTSTGTRGWAKIENGTLESDQNTLLRGGTLWDVPFVQPQYDYATSQGGYNPWPVFGQYKLNAVRLAVEYGTPQTGTAKTNPNYSNECAPWSASAPVLSLSQAMSVLTSQVAEAVANHMYAIIDLHCTSGGHDMTTAPTFWTDVAKQFGNNSNVIFELLNEPVAWEPVNYTDTGTTSSTTGYNNDIQDEETLYNDIRAVDTQTPIIMMSFAVPTNNDSTPLQAPTMAQVVAKLTGINWSNTAVGFHGYWDTNDTDETNLKASYPAIDTEFQSPCPPPSGEAAVVCPNGETSKNGMTWEEQTMEKDGISWLCWNCNDAPDQPGADDVSNLGVMEAAAQAEGWMWTADNP